MPKSKVTGGKAAASASETLRSEATGKSSKSAAGSALSQTAAPKKGTTPKAASAASKTLSDARTSKASKSAAGSAPSQKSASARGAAKKSPPKSPKKSRARSPGARQ